MCGFGIKRRWEFGDPRRAPITVLEMGFIKVCKMRGDSKLVEFMRGYADDKEFNWHPKVRIARRKAERKAYSYYDNHYKQQIRELFDRQNVDRQKQYELERQNKALLAVIELKKEVLEIQNQINQTDKEIDTMVYKLYDLTEDEIKIVEGV